MNINKMKRIIFISTLVLIVVISGISFTYAATSSELQQQQSDIDKKIDQTNSEIAGVKTEMSTALQQISKLNSEISTYQTEINNLQSQIGNLNTQIEEKETNIQEQQQKFDSQKEALEKRLVAMYETGTTSYLDVLLSSEGLADFISKYYMIEQLAEYDQELLDRIENTRQQIESEKNSLESTKSEVQTSKDAVETKKSALSTSVNQKNQLVSNLSQEEKELEEQLEQFEQDKRQIQAELAAISKKNPVKDVVAPSAAGYISPLAGKTKANITTGYGSYQTRSGRHTGVDFACSSGTPIRAVKSGTVVKSLALRYPNGNYKSYGEYVVIDHHDGTMTLYAHMSSRAVSVNQTVSQGQQIGSVGSTGNSTGPHLHFEVLIGGTPTNPVPYLP